MTAVATPPASAASPQPPEAALALPSGTPRATTSPPSIPGATVLGMGLVLAADFLILGVLLAAFFTVKGGAPFWPPKGIKLDIYLPTVITITAGMSATSMGWAVYAVRRHDVGNAIAAMVLTVVLGLAMVNLQWYSLSSAPFGIARHSYGTLYHLIIGYHLIHVAIGIVMLVVIGCRTLVGHFNRQQDEPVRAVAIFWQYGNVVWAVILVSVFLIARAHA